MHNVMNLENFSVTVISDIPINIPCDFSDQTFKRKNENTYNFVPFIKIHK